MSKTLPFQWEKESWIFEGEKSDTPFYFALVRVSSTLYARVPARRNEASITPVGERNEFSHLSKNPLEDVSEVCPEVADQGMGAPFLCF